MRRFRRGRWSLAGVLIPVLLGGACDNGGEGRVLGVNATGIVTAFAFFDRNGSGEADVEDEVLDDVRVWLVSRGTHDTVATALSDVDGAYRFTNIPVATYDIVIDTSRFADTVLIVKQDSTSVTVPPADSVDFTFGISYPAATVADLRNTLATGRKAFIEGVALVTLDTFGDTTMHVIDTTGPLRVVRVRRISVFAGDSVRLLGTRNVRDGQPVLDDVTIFSLGLGNIPPAENITTAEAATADGGRLDAALVRLVNIDVTDTATVAGDFIVTADDGSGALEIVLENEAGLDTVGLEPGVVIRVTGVLVPRATGDWVLKPRTDADVVIQ